MSTFDTYPSTHPYHSHVDNVALHKQLGVALVSEIDESLVADVEERLHWTLYAQGQGPVRGLGRGLAPGQGLGIAPTQQLLEKVSTPGGVGVGVRKGVGKRPLLVLLHGWMGAEQDFHPLIESLKKLASDRVLPEGRENAEGVATLSYDILTVTGGFDLISPSVFCRALRRVLKAIEQGPVPGTVPGSRQEQESSCTPRPSPTSSTGPYPSAHPSPGPGPTRPVVLVGYSQGGRLAMHYRFLFPEDVAAVVGVSAVPGKNNDRCVCVGGVF